MMELTPSMERFILHWGEMGQRWGVNRSVAQVHALLYLADGPLTAEDIAETLSMARSNVSTSIRELLGWGIIRRVPVMGDRRDHYESLHDVWEMFQIVLDERKKREIDPTMEVLRECLEQAKGEQRAPKHIEARLKDMLEFFETMNGWYSQVRRLPRGAMLKFVRMGKKIRGVVGA